MIAVNETGFLPSAVKLAISDRPGTFHIVDDNDGKTLNTEVKVVDAGFDETAGCEVYRLDFSGVTVPGIYHLESETGEKSVVFKVEPHVYKTLKNSLLKFFYFQRCGCGLSGRYAGPFVRNICHTKKVSGLFLPKGWHDAGDYGRYVSAGAVTVAHMLYAFELFPKAFNDPVNIPESGNGMPDILNECRYELEFLSEMQDEDGGVHHKVTSWTFCDFVMPDQDDEEQLLFPVTSMATANFAAVMCIASRLFEKQDPAFARDCIHQAYLAGQWLMAHPENTDFHNPEGCNTGEYTDSSDVDERMWAFAELLRTDHYVVNDGDRSMMRASTQKESRQDRYIAHLISEFDLYEKNHPHADGRSEDDGFGWQDVSSLAAVSVIFDPANRAGEELRRRMISLLRSRADAFVDMQKDGCPLAMKVQDFVWGSNMVVSNRADVMVLMSLVLKQQEENSISGSETGEIKEIRAAQHDIGGYEAAALNQIHYLLGMNFMNVSYVTGFGEHAVKNPHNRVTVADNIDRPIPGALSGGPCTLLADEEIRKTADKNTPAQKCHADHYLSYSTNEIAIYWNSSLLFAAAYFDR